MVLNRTILKNFLSLTTADFVAKGLGLLVIIYLARRFGPEEFGMLNFALSIIVYFSYIIDPGLSTLGVRNIARHPDTALKWTSDILGTRLLLSIFAFAVLMIMTAFLKKPLEIKILIILYGLLLFPQAIAPGWIFQGLQKMEYAAIYQIIQATFYAFLIFLLVKNKGHLNYVPVILVISTTIAGFVLLIALIKRAGIFPLKFNFSLMSSLVKTAIPIGIGTFLIYGLNWNISISLLGFLQPPSEVGYFSAAFRFIFIIVGIALAFESAVFPVISYYYLNSKETMKKTIHFVERLIIIFGIPLIIGTFLTAPQIITVVFGSQFLPSIKLLQIMMVGTVLYSFRTLYHIAMVACERQQKSMHILILSTLLLICLSLLFIQRYQSTGAAVAYVLSEFVSLLIYWYYVSDLSKMEFLKYVLKSVFASIVMAVGVVVLSDFNIFVRILVGMAIYFIGIIVTQGITRNEIVSFFNIIYRKPNE